MPLRAATLMTMGGIGTWLRRLYRLFASSRLAIVLLALLAALLAVYLLVPQDPKDAEALSFVVEKSGVAESLARALGFTDVQRSWLLVGTYALLFTNLLLCLIGRFGTAVRLSRFPKTPPPVSPLWAHRRVENTSFDAEAVAAAIRRKGYRTVLVGNRIYGLRGRFAMLGHWVFHLSLLLLLSGGMWMSAAPDPFRGTVGVGEGEPFDLQSAPFLATNTPPSQDLPEVRFKMERIEAVTEGKEVRQLKALISTPDGEQVELGINRPYRNGPYQVLVNGFGYMPGWVVVNKGGRMLRGAWVKMVPFPLPMEDSFSIGPGESTVTVSFFPDYPSNGNGARNRSHELLNPRFDTRVVWRGKQVFEGLLKPDEGVPLGAGQQFFFLPEIRRYGMLDIMQEQGCEIVFAGLGMMIVGIIIRYARTRKEVLVQVEGGGLQLFGRSEILENLFAEELERLAEELAEPNPLYQSGRIAS